MRILLTGSTGFIGSRLKERLREAYHEVHELVRFTAGGRWNYYGSPQVHFADLRDPDAVWSVVHQADPEVILHLGADSAVSYSFQRARDVFEVNTLGTVAMADAARKLSNLQLFIHASTSEVYGKQTAFPIQEDAPLNATSPYAASKIAGEEYLRVLHQAEGFPVCIVRPFNSYGRALVGQQHFVIERAIVSALTTGLINLHNPKPERDFMFREDHVDFYVHLVESKALWSGMCLNACTGKAYTIEEMAGIVSAAVMAQTGRGVLVDFKNEPDRPHDIEVLHGDSGKAQRMTPWRPNYSLGEGVEQAVREWRERIEREAPLPEAHN